MYVCVCVSSCDGLFWGQGALVCVLLLVAVVAHCTKLPIQLLQLQLQHRLQLQLQLRLRLQLQLNGEAKELKVFSISSVSAPARRSELVQNYV